MSKTLKNSVINIVTWVLVLLFFFPVFWMFLNGFKPESVASSVNPKLFFTPTLDGYQLAMDRGMAAYMQNSFMASIAATIAALSALVRGRSVEPVWVSRFTITLAMLTVTLGPLSVAICTMRPSTAAAS